MQRIDQNLDEIYIQLFDSFEKLETALKANDSKAVRSACNASCNLLSIYIQKTGSQASLSTAFDTLFGFCSYNPEDELSKLCSALQRDVIDLIWDFHAKISRPFSDLEYAQYTASLEKKIRKDLALQIDNNTQASISLSKSYPEFYNSSSLTELMNLFSYIPSDAMNLILVMLSNRDLEKMTNLSHAYHQPHSMFRSTLNIRRAFKEITEGGNIQLVKRMTEADKDLLTKRFNYTDYKGQEYLNVTLLHAALRAYNAGMKNMLKGQVEKYHSKEEMEKQVREEVSKWDMNQPAFDFSAIVAAITNSNDADIQVRLDKKENETNICKAFNTFREEFSKCIIEAPNFTPVHLLQALDVYNSNEPNWSNEKCWLFLRQVFGLAQRYCPAVVLQDFAQGIYYLVEQNKERLGSFKWAHDQGNIIDPASFFSPSGLGHDNWARGNGCLGLRAGGGRGALGPCCAFYKNYFKQHLQNLQPNLCCATDQHRMPGCGS